MYLLDSEVNRRPFLFYSRIPLIKRKGASMVSLVENLPRRWKVKITRQFKQAVKLGPWPIAFLFQNLWNEKISFKPWGYNFGGLLLGCTEVHVLLYWSPVLQLNICTHFAGFSKDLKEVCTSAPLISKVVKNWQSSRQWIWQFLSRCACIKKEKSVRIKID